MHSNSFRELPAAVEKVREAIQNLDDVINTKGEILTENQVVDMAAEINDRFDPDDPNYTTFDDPYFCDYCEQRYTDSQLVRCEVCGIDTDTPAPLRFKINIPKMFRLASSSSSSSCPRKTRDEELPSDSDSSSSSDKEDEEDSDRIYVAQKENEDITEAEQYLILDEGLEEYRTYKLVKHLREQRATLDNRLIPPLTNLIIEWLGTDAETAYKTYVEEEDCDQLEADTEEAAYEEEGNEDDEEDARLSMNWTRKNDIDNHVHSNQNVLYTQQDVDEYDSKQLASVNDQPDEDDIEEYEERQDALDNEYDVNKAEFDMEYKIFIRLEHHRRLVQERKSSKDEMDEDNEDIESTECFDVYDETVLGTMFESFYKNKLNINLDMISSATMEQTTELEQNGKSLVIPQLFKWGCMICVNGMDALKDWGKDWVGSEHGHTVLKFFRGTTPLLREINHRIIVLNPSWNDMETELRSYFEIQKEQSTTDLIIPQHQFGLLVREIGQDFMNDLKFEPEAIEALQHAAENYLVKLFNTTNLLAIHAGRTHIKPSDMALAKRIREQD